MPSQHILPVSNPKTPSSSSSWPLINSSAASAGMLIRSEDDLDMGTTRILMPPEDNKNEKKPLIPRTMSCTDAANSNSYFQQKRRRRVASANSLLTLTDGRGQSFQLDMGPACTDTYLLTRLGLKLLTYLGVGYRWITRFLALGFYSFLLFPGFLQVGYYYFFSKQIRRSVVYGDQPRNRLDLYLPKNADGPKPVVAFITGGAWIIVCIWILFENYSGQVMFIEEFSVFLC